MNIEIINIKNKKDALIKLNRYKRKEQSGHEIKLVNVHLLKINNLLGYRLFDKNDLYVTGETLYEIMQPIGEGHGRHHYHGLAPNKVLETLNIISNPKGVYAAGYQRYVIVTLAVNDTNENIVVIVEIGANLKNKRDANINKMVSMYPRRNIDRVIDKNKGVKF